MSFTTDATGVSSEVIGNVTSATGANTQQKFYTEEDLQAVREQEKSKLYKRIETLEASQTATQNALSTAERIAKEKVEAAEAEERKRLEVIASEEREKLTLRDQLKLEAEERKKMKEEFELRLAEEARKREEQTAIQEQERKFLQFNVYKTQRISEEKENIAPELLDLVSGNTPEDLEASIELLKSKTASILEAMQQATQAARQNTPGTRVTSPGTGLPDTNMGQNTGTQDDIASMSMADYAKNRHKYIGSAAANGNGGLFR